MNRLKIDYLLDEKKNIINCQNYCLLYHQGLFHQVLEDKLYHYFLIQNQKIINVYVEHIKFWVQFHFKDIIHLIYFYLMLTFTILIQLYIIKLLLIIAFIHQFFFIKLIFWLISLKTFLFQILLVAKLFIFLHFLFVWTLELFIFMQAFLSIPPFQYICHRKSQNRSFHTFIFTLDWMFNIELYLLFQ